MQNVRITPGESQKYVLVTVNDNGESKMLVWGNPEAEWHKDIVKEISEAGFEVVRVEGGGKIKLNPETRTIHLWDTSSRFGTAPFEVVRMVLETVYPEHRCSEQDPD